VNEKSTTRNEADTARISAGASNDQAGTTTAKGVATIYIESPSTHLVGTTIPIQ